MLLCLLCAVCDTCIACLLCCVGCSVCLLGMVCWRVVHSACFCVCGASVLVFRRFASACVVCVCMWVESVCYVCFQ